MRKFIHSDFQLDLSVFAITDTAENPWFSGNFFAKYSYPFNMELTDENDAAFGYILHHNSASAETYFEGIYVHGDKMERAVLEIEECEDVLSVTVRYGFDDFPNFKKKLSELPLISLPVDDIYTHAAGIITQTWPAVNYNFPQVHIDKIDYGGDDDTWADFEGTINNFRDGAFLENDVDVAEEISHNRNIMQPVPYLLYLLTAGFADAGYTLMGDILTDADFIKMLVYADCEYYRNLTPDSMTILVAASDYDSIVYESSYNLPKIHIHFTQAIAQKGQYRITGKFTYRYGGTYTNIMRIRYRGSVLAQYSTIGSPNQEAQTHNVDVVFDTIDDLNPDEILFEADVRYNEEDFTFDFEINPVILHDDEGNIVPSIYNPNRVDLVRAVPEMAFGDLVKAILAMKNMDIEARGTEIWINYIPGVIASRTTVDLSMFEVKRPKRKFSKGNSFLFEYQDVDSEKYTYAKVFQDIEGSSTSGYTIDEEKTTSVTINALPLPQLYRNSVQTAHGFLQDNSKPFFIFYGGLVNGLNLTTDTARLLIPFLHENYLEDWFEARLNSTEYNWKFLAWYEQLTELIVKGRINAYGNIHLVKSLQKTEQRPDLFEVEIETSVFR